MGDSVLRHANGMRTYMHVLVQHVQLVICAFGISCDLQRRIHMSHYIYPGRIYPIWHTCTTTLLRTILSLHSMHNQLIPFDAIPYTWVRYIFWVIKFKAIPALSLDISDPKIAKDTDNNSRYSR